jgi:amidophosphoribosyltransferase
MGKMPFSARQHEKRKKISASCNNLSDSLREECGVVGAISFSGKDVSQILYRSLIALQHRGQDAAGIAILDSKSSEIKVHKGLGLVNEVFGKDLLLKISGPLGIGHVRYPTIGAGGIEDAQPFFENNPFGGIALAHNGNIANYGTLRSILEKEGRVFNSTCDADLILAVLARNLEKAKLDIFNAISLSMQELDGAYSVCAITAQGKLVIYRDPHAIRPLVWGKSGDFVVFASESVALDINGIELKGDVGAGEAIVISIDGEIKRRQISNLQPKHCFFEYVYFSRPDSIAQGKLIYNVRRELGRRLARAAPTKADIVVAVPDTSRPVAEGYSQESGIPMEEGLMKNRYVGRTFIMPSQSKRFEAVRLKLNAVRPLVEGKRIVLIDDSIVRGTTCGPIIKLLRDAKAKEIHLRIACPPIIAPCFYGVDMPSYDELIASKMSVEQIRKLVGADSLVYATIEDLVEAIGIKKSDLCLGCITNNYPTAWGNKIADLLAKDGSDPNVRIWEKAHIIGKKGGVC